jgi:hypothetical protein
MVFFVSLWRGVPERWWWIKYIVLLWRSFKSLLYLFRRGWHGVPEVDSY